MSAVPAGCSGKPLWQKRGLTPALRVHLRGLPAGDYAALTGMAPDTLNRVGPRAAFDLAHVFTASAAELARMLVALDRRLPPAGTI